MDKTQLEAKRQDAETRFNDLKKQEETLVEQIRELNQKLGTVREEMVRIQGDYRTIDGLIKDLEPTDSKTDKK